MAWNEEVSKKRVSENDFHDFEVNVADLARTMDFSKLSTKDVRRTEAAHLYADVPNFHLAVADAGADKQKQKKLIRAASVLRKVQSDLLKDELVGRIQLQAARLHAVCFKPYGDEERRAKRAVIMAITLNSYLYDTFNGVFSDVRDFQGAVGIDAGKSLVANVGHHGDRERICLGTCANRAAKVINGRDTITITDVLYTLLPEDLQELFSGSGTVAGAATYQAVGVRWKDHGDLAKKLGVTFDEQKWRKRTEEYRDDLPLYEMDVTEAEVLIDLSQRTERNSKRTNAIALYADLDGFTQYVQEAEDDEAVVSLVRTLHMIRHEFHAVLKRDYPGLVLQHQGDRVFAILHLPTGDLKRDQRCRKAVDAAIALQSSMEDVLREHLGNRKNLHVAVGLDLGTALVTRLGKQGKREAICLGPEVTSAERLQLRSGAKQIRISEQIYEAIDDEKIKEEFRKEGRSYVATGLTFSCLDEKEEEEEEEAVRRGTLGAASTGSCINVVPKALLPARPYGEGQ